MNTILSALEDFKKASINLEAEMEKTNLDFSEDYPFDKSYEDIVTDIIFWVNTQTTNIKGADGVSAPGSL